MIRCSGCDADLWCRFCAEQLGIPSPPEKDYTDAEAFRLVGDWIQAQRLADEDGRYGDLRQIRDDVYAEAKRLEKNDQ